MAQICSDSDIRDSLANIDVPESQNDVLFKLKEAEREATERIERFSNGEVFKELRRNFS